MKILRLSLLLVVLDQLCKLYFKGVAIPWLGVHVAGWSLGESHEVIGNFVRLTYIENPGMAFGVNFGDSTKLFFSAFSLLASGAIVWYLYVMRHGPTAVRVALALILAGAFGNFIDRAFYGVLYGTAPLFHGSVVDFMDVDFFTMSIGRFHLDRWPVFNVADSCVSIGVILFVITAQRRTTAPVPSTLPPASETAGIPSGTPDPTSSEANHLTEGTATHHEPPTPDAA